MDIHIKNNLSIPERELTFTASRSSGPGGQHVNKVNSRLTLHFNVPECPALSPTQKKLLFSSLASRITTDGIFRLDCQKHRMQSMNRAELIERFSSLLRGALTPKQFRVATRISKSVKNRRLEEKKRHGQIKKKRSTHNDMD